MRSMILSLLVAGQLAAAAQPALAAEFDATEQTRVGMFGGMQVRLPLGGEERTRRPSIAIGIAPTTRSQRIEGAGRTRIGQGLALDFAARRPELRLAGTQLNRLSLTPSGRAPDGQRVGISTLGWVGIGLGVVVVSVLVLGQLCADGEVCGSDRDD